MSEPCLSSKWGSGAQLEFLDIKVWVCSPNGVSGVLRCRSRSGCCLPTSELDPFLGLVGQGGYLDGDRCRRTADPDSGPRICRPKWPKWMSEMGCARVKSVSRSAQIGVRLGGRNGVVGVNTGQGHVWVYVECRGRPLGLRAGYVDVASIHRPSRARVSRIVMVRDVQMRCYGFTDLEVGSYFGPVLVKL